MLYARIANGLVAELVTPPAGFTINDIFHADVAAQFVEVPNGISPQQGWVYSGGTFSAPTFTISVDQALVNLANLLNTKETMGVMFTPTGAPSAILFSTDPDAQTKYTAVWNSINATPPLRADGDFMIAANGTPVALSNADAKALIQKALSYFQACTARYAQLQPLLATAPSTNITTGWPPNT